jgi:hypothetical protein
MCCTVLIKTIVLCCSKKRRPAFKGGRMIKKERYEY